VGHPVISASTLYADYSAKWQSTDTTKQNDMIEVRVLRNNASK